MTFFFTLTIILLGCILLRLLCKKIHLPALIGYLLLGILLAFLEDKFSTDSFHFLDPNISSISSYLRKIALIIILAKAGLSLNLSDLKKVGRPAILMSFLPAVIEMCAVGIFAPLLFPSLNYIDSFLLGSVLGAVSPAVVVPMMSKLMDEQYGTEKGIPQLIIAASSIDDIIMIVFFQCFLSMEKGNNLSYITFLNIPSSIILGILLGVLFGFSINLILKFKNIDETILLILIFGISFGFTLLEEVVSSYIGISSLLAVISMCVIIKLKNPIIAKNLVSKCNKLWILSEMFLFVLVGACIKINYAGKYFLLSLLLLLISLSFRSLAVSLSLIKTKLNLKERSFTIISYIPKATVQAAIGSTLLDLGNQLLQNGITTDNAYRIIEVGTIVLSVSVVAILITAPLGAILMNSLYKHTLEKNETIKIN